MSDYIDDANSSLFFTLAGLSEAVSDEVVEGVSQLILTYKC